LPNSHGANNDRAVTSGQRRVDRLRSPRHSTGAVSIRISPCHHPSPSWGDRGDSCSTPGSA
jgi:hypothetical protein